MGFRVKPENRWKDGIIPYEFSEQKGKCIPADSGVREIVIACMREWERMVADPTTNTFYIRFRPREEDEKPYLLITGSLERTSGGIGLSSLKEQASSLEIGYVNAINAIPHELGHVIGLYHENERNLKRTEYDAKVGPLLCPIKDSIAEYTATLIKDAIGKGTRLVEGSYDLWSLMHYPTMDKQWAFNCSLEKIAEFHNTVLQDVLDKFAANHDGKYTLNYPTVDDVMTSHWYASPGDIATVRKIYT